MSTSGRVRLDKWLWAARFYKTRSQSSAAIKGGKVELGPVEVGTVRAKPSHKVGVGDHVHVRKGPYEFHVRVTGLAERRGSAEKARALYAETAESIATREETHRRIAADRVAMPKHWTGGGRPTKKQRRAMMAFQDQYPAPDALDDVDWDWAGESDSERERD